MNAVPQARRRAKLLLIAGLFLLPFAVAVVLRFGGWEPPRTRNFGELLAPPLPMHALEARTAQDEPWRFENTEQHWTMLVRLPLDCADPCRERLAVLPNVREALGRHADRLTQFRLGDDAGGSVNATALPPLQLTGALPGPLAAAPDATLPDVVLVDPHGYLVLHYPPGFDPSGLRKDLARLLR